LPLVLVFVDGLGLGTADAQTNPLTRAGMFFLRERFRGRPLTVDTVGAGLAGPDWLCRPVNPTLGVAGLPQSATGQTVIFTGVNAAQVAGRHVNGFPTKALRQIIQEHSLFKVLNQAGYKAIFANTFTKEYFETTARGRWRHSVTTTAAMAGDCRLLQVDDLLRGLAVYQDIINEALQAKGYQAPLVRPEAAADNLARLAAQNDFTLFEYFQTDRCGHKQDWDGAWVILNRLDRFIGTLAGRLTAAGLDLLLVSDHGNIEDLTVKTHTLNPVPVMAVGARAAEFGAVTTLLDIYPTVLRYFGIKRDLDSTNIQA
jgi:2,3-bisphosphoglycerate-independent phosphoglycerate mutase